jgi:hypothetical protein
VLPNAEMLVVSGDDAGVLGSASEDVITVLKSLLVLKDNEGEVVDPIDVDSAVVVDNVVVVSDVVVICTVVAVVVVVTVEVVVVVVVVVRSLMSKQ